MYAELGEKPDGPGVLAALHGDRFEAYSAGCTPTDEIRPYAVEAMDEVSIDMDE